MRQLGIDIYIYIWPHAVHLQNVQHPGVTHKTVPRNAQGQPPPHPVVPVGHSARLPGHQFCQGKAVPLGLFFWGFNVYMFAKQCCLCVHCVPVWSLQKRK